MIDLAILVLIVAAVLGCHFAACSIALRTFSRTRLAELMENRGGHERYERFVDRTPRLGLMTNTLRTCLSLIVLLSALHWVERYFTQPGYTQLAQYAIAFVLAGAIVSIVIVGIASSWAQHAPERILVWSMTYLDICFLLFAPIASVLHVFDPLVKRISGSEGNGEGENPLRDEILSVVEEHQDQAPVDQNQREMLEAVIDLPQMTAGQVMTPRTDMVGLEVNATLEEVKTLIIGEGPSRIPVYESDLDHIIGILYAKDLIQYLGANAPFDLRKVIRPAMMVPESKSLRELLAEFKARKVHMAIVLDEYGGTAGLITIEDVIEEIVGDIEDEYESEEENPEVRKLDEMTAEVDARVYVDDLNDALDLDLPEDDDYDTVGGFVFSALGHIPEVGESFEFGRVKVTVMDAERTKVKRVRVEKLVQNTGQDGGVSNGK